jgi:signal transduction histidine kinase
MSLLHESKETRETFEEMAATVAHEIKNPLALAMANLDIIRLCDTEGKYEKYCAVIKKELIKINSLVLDLINSVREDEKEEEVDLSAMLEALIHEYSDRYGSIQFVRNQADERLWFYCQPKRIRMIFTNLLNNAVEALEEHGLITITEEVTRTDFRIVINDNGMGLVDNKFNNPYYTTKKNGTGLGLRYCRNTVAQYGGRFVLRNRPEGGCQAVVELPRQCD